MPSNKRNIVLQTDHHTIDTGTPVPGALRKRGHLKGNSSILLTNPNYRKICTNIDELECSREIEMFAVINDICCIHANISEI